MTIGEVTTRRSRYYHHHEERLKLARPNLLALPSPVLAWIFVLSQNSNLLRTCRGLCSLGQDFHVRAEYLQYQHLHATQATSFFVRMLKQVPPVANARLWVVFQYRKMLDSTMDRDVYWVMRQKERQCELSSVYWNSLVPDGRAMVLQWMAECCEDFNWSPATLHLAVLTMDRYFTQQPKADVQKTQLVAGACLSLVSKSEEQNLAPTRLMAQLSQATPSALCALEIEIMKTLNWEVINFPSAEMFLSYFVSYLRQSKYQLVPYTYSPSPTRTPSPSTSCACARTSPSPPPSPLLQFTIHSIQDDPLYIGALARIDSVILNQNSLNGLVPSVLAAWALWKQCLDTFNRPPDAALFHEMTGYSEEQISCSCQTKLLKA